MQIQPTMVLTVAREHQGWFVLGDSRFGPFSEKALASELAIALAGFFRSLGYSVSVHISMWTSGPRSHAAKAAVQPAGWPRREAEPTSWAIASGAADLMHFFGGAAEHPPTASAFTPQIADYETPVLSPPPGNA